VTKTLALVEPAQEIATSMATMAAAGKPRRDRAAVYAFGQRSGRVKAKVGVRLTTATALLELTSFHGSST